AMPAEIAGTLWMLAAAAALVLVVACANVANLTLVRADARRREIAVREALGAGRGRVTMHLLAESSVVAAAAATLGLAVAAVAVRGLVKAAPAGIPRLADVGVDARVLPFPIAVAALVAVACGLLSALRISGGPLALREGALRATASRAERRLRSGLVAAQIAIALVVLAGSGLLIRTHQRLNAVRPGFDPEHVS